MIELLSTGRIDVTPLVGLDTSLDRWQEGFDAMHDGSIPKAVLRP